MKLEICAIYCICDDYLKELKSIAWHNEKMKDSEVMTSLIVATQFFGGNITQARIFLLEHGYVPDMLSINRLNERIHRIPMPVWEGLLRFMRRYTPLKSVTCFIVDSFPIQICKNVRMLRSRLLTGKKYHGFNASKKEFFYGYKASLITCEYGTPVSLNLAPGSMHDLSILKQTSLEHLSTPAQIVGDAAYLSQSYKDELKQANIELITDKRANSKERLLFRDWAILKRVRKSIETSISLITRLMPKCIRAVTSRGFMIKVIGFVIAYGFTKINI